MKYKIEKKIRKEFLKYLDGEVVKTLTWKMFLAIFVLLGVICYDVFVKLETQFLLIRFFPLSIAVGVLLFHLFFKNKYAPTKRVLYNLFLISLFVMMLMRCLKGVDGGALHLVIVDTILVIFVLSIELKACPPKVIFVYSLPIIIFNIIVLLDNNFTKLEQYDLLNIYPIAFVGFLFNTSQFFLHYNYFVNNFKLTKKKDRANELYNNVIVDNKKLDNKNKKVKAQKEKIEELHWDILEGVEAAKRIQKAMFPKKDMFRENFQDFFILYLPAEKVSGDFYWATKVENKFIYAIADCAGHGISSALVSILGLSLLNKIVNQHKNIQAAEILDMLRDEVKKSLKQTALQKDEDYEGLDIALCIINSDNLELQFAGANISLYVFNGGQVIELKPDRQPVGIWINERKFRTQRMQLQRNDVLFTVSDGFKNQLNENMEKYTNKRCKDFLTKVVTEKSLSKHKTLLKNEHYKWRGTQKQTDDVLALGIRI